MAKFFEFEVSLQEIKPRIWRRFQIKASSKFSALHDAIQRSFGWLSYHLWEFRESGKKGKVIAGLTDAEPFDGIEPPDGARIALASFFTEPGKSCLYLYDFGDDWSHEVKLLRVFNETGFSRRLVGGERSCPPEDCGGTYGYERIIHFRKTGKDSEGDAVALGRWLGDWQPEAFDLKEAKRKFDQETKAGKEKTTPAKSPEQSSSTTPKKLSESELRQTLEGLSKEALVDLVLRMVHAKHTEVGPDFDATERATELRKEIERALSIDFVEEYQVDAYISKLDELLDKSVGLAKIETAKGLEVLWFFLQKLPTIFDLIMDEYELEAFCAELIESLLLMSGRAQAPAKQTALDLLDFYLNDTHGRFLSIPKQLQEGAWSPSARLDFASAALSLLEKADKQQTVALRALAASLSATSKLH